MIKMSKISQSDYDKKYQEDLEKAQALSLETLALEKFRQEKQKTELQNTHSFVLKSGHVALREKNTSNSNNSEKVRNRNVLSKATQRPRPSCIEPKLASLPKIPPPQVIRRDGTSTSSWETSNSSDDLISFHSCYSNDTLQYSSYLQKSSHSSTAANSEFIQLNRQPSSSNSPSTHDKAFLNPGPFHFYTISNAAKSTSGVRGTNFHNTHTEKKSSGNLIDFNTSTTDGLTSRDKNVRVSLLEAFDPLVTCDSQYASPKDVIYESYDPFDFLYSTIADSISPNVKQEPIYSTITKTTSSPIQTPAPPLPPRNSTIKKDATKKVKTKCSSRLYENIIPIERRTNLHDPDVIAFHLNVKEIRERYDHTDSLTNLGIVISPMIENCYKIDTSIKLIIHCSSLNIIHPINLTCDVNSSVEHVLMHIVCELDSDSVEQYILKVYGLAEYLESNTCLADYEYVHNCIKLEKDVELSLLRKDSIYRKLLRTEEDDIHDKPISLAELLPKEPVQPISYESLLIVLETLENEIDRIIAASRESTDSFSNIQPLSVLQAVKAVCALLGNIETLQISQALDNFVHACEEFPISQSSTRSKPEIVDDSGNYSVVVFRDDNFADNLYQHCDNIRSAVQGLIKMYCCMFRADFQLLPLQPIPTTSKLSSEISDSVLLYIGCVHRISQKWSSEEFSIEAQIFHGTRPVSSRACSQPVMLEVSTSPYKRAVFDTWLHFEGINTYQSIPVSALPRESRIVVVVIGQKLVEETIQKVELGWAAIQLFNYNGELVQGSYMLPFWEGERSKRLGPAPGPGTHPYGDVDPVIGIELQDYGCDIKFPKIEIHPIPPDGVYDFCSLDLNTQQQLLEIISQDTFSNPMDVDREIMWEKRHYLLNHPQALPKVLLAAHSWDYSCLQDLHSMLHSWAALDHVSALQLLLPCFADNEVRSFAVGCISKLKSDELVDYLPQIVQALKYENYEASALAKLLLERSLSSPRVAHYLYWLLVQELPGGTPQNSCELVDKSLVSEARYYRRLQLVLRALWAISGEALRKTFVSQDLLVKRMSDIAENVKQSKESTRLNVLMEGLHGLHKSLSDDPTCLPLSPSLHVNGIHVKSSSYFPSNTLPLKINFTSEEAIIPAIFKVGDDLKQDMLTLQMIRIMNKLWLKEGLDLKIVTFGCVPTGFKKGMIEMVPEAETLRKIQVEFGVTGSFKEWPIAEWLAKHNPSALDYERAVANFTASCAGYCVATYVLGICDRHNDNIMLKTSGHLFHIDFGKFLGDAQMFGNFKRDRTPFVLTSDMAYVINGGDKPSAKFHNFVDLCCNAFNIVRKRGNILLNLFGLMASSGAAGLTVDSVRYVQDALLPELSNAEAAATFARMIQSSLKSWFTQINFFLHNLAQLRFTGDHNDDELLSFVPKRYSMHQEGRLKSVEVYGYQKRYDPEKYYMYILKVERVGQKDPSYLFRSYKEFCEFHQKLCLLFPLVKCYSLPGSSLHMGRSNIKQVADKRMHDIKKFLQSLFIMADEICHSDLVYTFFHPLLRDQQESSIHEHKLKEQKKDRNPGCSSNFIKGQIKLSFYYQRETLWVMVHHVRELPSLSGGQEPSTYVKVYLLPDPIKATKRKTKVVRKNCHPSFMETLEYRMPLEIVQERFLQATVWNHDTLQENEFLGGTTINLADVDDLTKEVTGWYLLGNVSRRLMGNMNF
nr:phosphatidylinositol 4-phosphate 3-kinase C2 domain-containing subunit beta isoform X2 [Halyomorpha halys]